MKVDCLHKIWWCVTLLNAKKKMWACLTCGPSDGASNSVVYVWQCCWQCGLSDSAQCTLFSVILQSFHWLHSLARSIKSSLFGWCSLVEVVFLERREMAVLHPTKSHEEHISISCAEQTWPHWRDLGMKYMFFNSLLDRYWKNWHFSQLLSQYTEKI